jgi:nitroreductase
MSAPTDTKEPLFSDVIRGRRSVRSYDTSVNLSHEEIKELLAEAMLAPSSGNLQSSRFLVIDSEELKRKLLPVANNQSQIIEASAIIVVLGDTEYYLKADQIFGSAIEKGYMPAEKAASSIERINAYLPTISKESLHKIIHIDGGLISQQLMLVARAHGYDTVPMGGYDVDKLKEAFGLGDRYIPIILIALGKAAKAGHPSTRLPVEDVAFFNEIPEK